MTFNYLALYAWKKYVIKINNPYVKTQGVMTQERRYRMLKYSIREYFDSLLSFLIYYMYDSINPVVSYKD